MERKTILWSVIRSVLQERIRFGIIKEMLGRTGADTITSPAFQTHSLLDNIDSQFRAMKPPEQSRFLRIITEELLRRRPDLEPELRDCLERLGWTLYEGTIVQVDVLDISELPELPEEAHTDLLKAATRFRDGDLSGALAAACGAVDAVTTKIYAQKSLGDPGNASFQEKVKKSLGVQGTFTLLEEELAAAGWDPQNISMFKNNLVGALNQGAFVMQKLRSEMSDVHGTKPILKPLVFDSIKWAALIIRMLD
jgi:hypothetical protein